LHKIQENDQVVLVKNCTFIGAYLTRKASQKHQFTVSFTVFINNLILNKLFSPVEATSVPN